MLMSCEDLIIKDIIDIENLDKSLVIKTKTSDEVFFKGLPFLFYILIYKIPIAAAIIAYARMERAEILLDESLNILYFDTEWNKIFAKGLLNYLNINI
jgi:hypothetical protein